MRRKAERMRKTKWVGVNSKCLLNHDIVGRRGSRNGEMWGRRRVARLDVQVEVVMFRYLGFILVCIFKWDLMV